MKIQQKGLATSASHISYGYIYIYILNKSKNLTSHFGMVQEKNLKINFSDNFQFYFSIYFKSFDNMPDPVTYRRQRKLFRFCRSIKNSSDQSVSLKNKGFLNRIKASQH